MLLAGYSEYLRRVEIPLVVFLIILSSSISYLLSVSLQRSLQSTVSIATLVLHVVIPSVRSSQTFTVHNQRLLPPFLYLFKKPNLLSRWPDRIMELSVHRSRLFDCFKSSVYLAALAWRPTSSHKWSLTTTLLRMSSLALSAWCVLHSMVTLSSLRLMITPQTCIAILYCAITYILHIDNILPYLINTGMDGMMLIALIVVAVVVGKPLSYLNCQVIGTSSVAESASQLRSELHESLTRQGGKVIYGNWIGANKTTCYEMKAIWGLSIALW